MQKSNEDILKAASDDTPPKLVDQDPRAHVLRGALNTQAALIDELPTTDSGPNEMLYQLARKKQLMTKHQPSLALTDVALLMEQLSADLYSLRNDYCEVLLIRMSPLVFEGYQNLVKTKGGLSGLGTSVYFCNAPVCLDTSSDVPHRGYAVDHRSERRDSIKRSLT